MPTEERKKLGSLRLSDELPANVPATVGTVYRLAQWVTHLDFPTGSGEVVLGVLPAQSMALNARMYFAQSFVYGTLSIGDEGVVYVLGADATRYAAVVPAFDTFGLDRRLWTVGTEYKAFYTGLAIQVASTAAQPGLGKYNPYSMEVRAYYESPGVAPTQGKCLLVVDYSDMPAPP